MNIVDAFAVTSFYAYLIKLVCFKIVLKKSEKKLYKFVYMSVLFISRASGGTGRRAGFRFQCREAWGFKSLLAHHS